MKKSKMKQQLLGSNNAISRLTIAITILLRSSKHPKQTKAITTATTLNLQVMSPTLVVVSYASSKMLCMLV